LLRFFLLYSLFWLYKIICYWVGEWLLFLFNCRIILALFLSILLQMWSSSSLWDISNLRLNLLLLKLLLNDWLFEWILLRLLFYLFNRLLILFYNIFFNYFFYIRCQWNICLLLWLLKMHLLCRWVRFGNSFNFNFSLFNKWIWNGISRWSTWRYLSSIVRIVYFLNLFLGKFCKKLIIYRFSSFFHFILLNLAL